MMFHSSKNSHLFKNILFIVFSVSSLHLDTRKVMARDLYLNIRLYVRYAFKVFLLNSYGYFLSNENF